MLRATQGIEMLANGKKKAPPHFSWCVLPSPSAWAWQERHNSNNLYRVESTSLVLVSRLSPTSSRSFLAPVTLTANFKQIHCSILSIHHLTSIKARVGSGNSMPVKCQKLEIFWGNLPPKNRVRMEEDQFCKVNMIFLTTLSSLFYHSCSYPSCPYSHWCPRY